MLRDIFILIVLLAFAVLGQKDNLSYRCKADDFNNDRVIDTLCVAYTHGSGFEGTRAYIKNGKTHVKQSIERDACYCGLISIAVIPPSLLDSNNEGFLKALQNKLAPRLRNKPGSSLQWLLDCYAQGIMQSDTGYFSRVLHFVPRWYGDSALDTFDYQYKVKDNELRLLYKKISYSEYPDWYHESCNATGWLYYSGSWVTRELEIGFSKSYKRETYPFGDAYVEVFGNAVALRKAGKHLWLFVTDNPLTGSPNKITIGSISKVCIGEGLVFIMHSTDQYGMGVYIVNPEKGFVGLLNRNRYSDRIESVENIALIKDSLLISGKSGENTKTVAISIVRMSEHMATNTH